MSKPFQGKHIASYMSQRVGYYCRYFDHSWRCYDKLKCWCRWRCSEMKMNHNWYTLRGVSYTRCTQLCTTLRITLLHTSWVLRFRLPDEKLAIFLLIYISTKRAQILLLNFFISIFYDLNSIWHQVIWICKMLVKMIRGLKTQNSSTWRWRSLGSNCGARVTSTPHLRWERLEVWIASQTTHPYVFLRLSGFSSK